MKDTNLKQILNSPITLLSAAIIGSLTILSLSAEVNPGYGMFYGFIPIIIGASWFILLLAYVNAKYDAAIIKQGQNVNHPIRFILRAVLAAGFSLIAFGFTTSALWLTIYQGALFWISFDILLARFRGLAWNYISIWKGTSKLDLLFKGKWLPFLLTKVAILIVSLIFLYGRN